ncbi:MAG: zf-HC2 domain-containing protein [Bacteroidota bacterium]
MRKHEIKAYLDGTLSEQERFDIENHLLECQLCSVAIDGAALHKPFYSKKLIALLALLAFLLLTSLLIYFYWPQPDKTDTIFYAYYELPANITPRNNLSIAGEEGITLFHKGKYADAIQLFDRKLENQADAKVLFYAGIAAIELQQLDRAVDYFKEAELLSSPYSVRAKWYHGLALLKQGKVKEATPIFEQLTTTASGLLKVETKEILEKIKGI